MFFPPSHSISFLSFKFLLIDSFEIVVLIPSSEEDAHGPQTLDQRQQLAFIDCKVYRTSQEGGLVRWAILCHLVTHKQLPAG